MELMKLIKRDYETYKYLFSWGEYCYVLMLMFIADMFLAMHWFVS